MNSINVNSSEQKAGRLLAYIASQFDLQPEQLPDGGWLKGDPESRISKIAVAWRLTGPVLQKALNEDCDFIVFHESPYWQERRDPELYRSSGAYKSADDWLLHPDKKLRQLVENSKACFLQIHYGLDRLCIYDCFIQALGLQCDKHGEKYECVYTLQNPMSLEQIAAQICRRLKLDCVRILGNPQQITNKFGNCWGGVGLSANLYFIRRAIEMGAELIIAGEMDEMGMRFMQDCGVAAIEPGHYISEAIGLQYFAEQVCPQIYDSIPAKFYAGHYPRPWQMYQNKL
ncbi:MAG: Nif3-like dinuclear metal center hexameric protein [Lentisphaeria bacterium]|nr:Nif3-like dinuclear metal center hexameric protein [Lentisphaeria bacterium]